MSSRTVNSPGEALAQRVAASAEEPWLFHRPELDWRWCSWSQVARGVAASERVLVEQHGDLRPGARVPMDQKLHPDAIAWCLALQSQGFVAAPQSEAETLSLPSIPGPFEKDRSPTHPSMPTPVPREPGSVVLRSPTGDSEEVPFPDLLAGGEAAFAGLPPTSARDIVVLTGSLADPVVQLVLAWSLRSAAALLLEPTDSAYAPTVEWARPTLLVGTAASLIALHDRLHPKVAPPRKFWRSLSLRRPARGLLARPLDRVRAVVVLDDPGPADAAVAKWESLGMLVLSPSEK